MQYGAIWCIVQCQVVSPDPRMSVGPSFRHPTQKGGEGARAERNLAVGFKAVELVGVYLGKWFQQIFHPYCSGAGAVHRGVGEARWEGPHPDLLGKRQHHLSRLWRRCGFLLGHSLSFGGKVVFVKVIFISSVLQIPFSSKSSSSSNLQSSRCLSWPP